MSAGSAIDSEPARLQPAADPPRALEGIRPLRAISLMYHDVLSDERWDTTGFPGPGAARYKLHADDFERHLDAIARVREGAGPAPTVLELTRAPAARPPVLLTFDDGGASATDEIAGRLERRGWRGHFFIPTDYLGATAFLDRARVRELHARGHVIGSHSASHPPRISACTHAEMLEEWRRSVGVLSEIIGEPVRTASVPEGYYSPGVAKTAAMAGIEVLFTSAPTTRGRHIAGCLVLGRHAMMRGASPELPAALAAGRLLPSLGQALRWNLKQLIRTIGGEHYLRMRARLLATQR